MSTCQYRDSLGHRPVVVEGGRRVHRIQDDEGGVWTYACEDPAPRTEDKRYAVGVQAFRDGKTRIASHRQPCQHPWCKRPECRGYRDAARHSMGLR
jgi:hypothetical protein